MLPGHMFICRVETLRPSIFWKGAQAGMHVLWLAFLETPRAYRAHNAQLLLRVVFKVIVQRKSFAVWFHFWKEPTNFGLGNTLNVTLPYKVY